MINVFVSLTSTHGVETIGQQREKEKASSLYLERNEGTDLLFLLKDYQNFRTFFITVIKL